MSQSINIEVREHHFYVATAKHVFLHQKHGIVFVRDPLSLKDAAQHGLIPLILYGVTVPGTSIKWITFSTIDQPRTFTNVLEEAWRRGDGLRGKPDILKISRYVAGACPELVSCLAKVEVDVVVADGKDKLFSASLRSAHLKSTELSDPFWREDLPPDYNLEVLNSTASVRHYLDSQTTLLYLTGKRQIEVDKWLNLPFHSLDSSLDDVNWIPGPWLSAWEAHLPPSSPRFFTKDTPKWLILGKEEDFAESSDDDPFETEPQSPLETIKLIMQSFPNSVNEVAREIGVTRNELQWYLTRRSELPGHVISRLLIILNIKMCEEGYYQANYQAIGPCVLVARSIKGIERAYEELSNGGDLEFSFEALPDKGMPDPSWRYVVFQRCGGGPNIIMISRGSRVSEQLNTDITIISGDSGQLYTGLFIDFEGEKLIPASIYREIVKTCANACAAPINNTREIERFAKRHSDYLRGLERWW